MILRDGSVKLIITDSASKWFQSHYALKPGDGIKLYGKTVQPRNVKHGSWQGFTLENDLINAAVVESKDGINYHVDFDDSWFFSGLVTLIDYQNGDSEPSFSFQRAEGTVTEANFTGENVDATTGASSRFEDYWE